MVILLTFNFDQSFSQSTFSKLRQCMNSKLFSLLPVNIPAEGKQHWYLLMVYRNDMTSTSPTSLYLLDPLGQKKFSSEHYNTILLPFLKKVFNDSSETTYNIHFVNVPPQPNAFDCGVYLMLYLYIIWFRLKGKLVNVASQDKLLDKLEKYSDKLSSPNHVSTLRQRLYELTQKLLPKETIIKYSGIINEGYTCYINVVLQIIFCLSDTLLEMYEDIFIKQINKFENTSNMSTWKIILDLFIRSISVNKRGSPTCIKKEDIRALRTNLQPNSNLPISDNHNSDPHELLIYLIDVGGPYFKSLRFSLNCRKVCNTCKSSLPRVQQQDESVFTIPVPLTERNIDSIVENVLRTDNDVTCYCEVCKRDCLHTMVDHCMEPHPKTLILQIGRFSGKRKEDVVDIFANNYEANLFGKTYRLQGVVYHIGDSIDEGHYYVECVRPTMCSNSIQDQERRWHRFDDEEVTIFTEKHKGFKGPKEQQIKMANCYLLMYERV